MAYTKHVWAQGYSGGTPVTHTKLNEMETGIYDAHTAISGHTNNISNLGSRCTALESTTSAHTSAISTINSSLRNVQAKNATQDGDITQLFSDVSSVQSLADSTASTVTSQASIITGHTSDISTLSSEVDTLDTSVSGLSTTTADHETRITTLETSGGGGAATLTVSQYVNNGTWTIANNAWLVSPKITNRPSYTNPSDFTIANQNKGVLQCLKTGIYLMSVTCVDTANPTGQANFMVNTVKVNNQDAGSVLQVLSRFQFYATNQGAGASVFSVAQGDYISWQFRQNASGGSMTLPDGVAAVQGNTYVGCAIAFVKVG